MRSITTKRDKYGWSHTFRKTDDGTITIIQKNEELKEFRKIDIFGENVLKAFYEICSEEAGN